MKAATTTYEHIALDDQGVAVIAGANTKVIEVVLAHKAHGMSPEELAYQLPHLSMGQIHSALDYYWDHKQELDEDIQRRYQEMEDLRREIQPTELLARLRARRAS
jgi:uncharacterized protein (DUF433 family)